MITNKEFLDIMSHSPDAVFNAALELLCDGSVLCECQECANAREEMVKFGHWVPTKEWEENASGATGGKPTGEDLEEKLNELY